MIDCPLDDAPVAQAAVENAGMVLGVRVGPAVRSPGSDSDARRVRFTVATPRGRASAADIETFMASLRRNFLPQSYLVADVGLLADPAAILLDLSTPGALARVWH